MPIGVKTLAPFEASFCVTELSKTSRRSVLAMLLFCVIASAPGQAGTEMELWSSGRKACFKLAVNQDGELTYSIDSDRKARIRPSRLGITVDGVDLGAKVRLGPAKTWTISETFQWRGNKAV